MSCQHGNWESQGCDECDEQTAMWYRAFNAGFEAGREDGQYWVRQYLDNWERNNYESPNPDMLRAIVDEFRMVLPWPAPKEKK